jgi:hypothetical protein
VEGKIMFRQSHIRSALAAGAATLTLAAGFAGSASAQTVGNGPLDQVLGCSAPGGQQTTGALLGAVLGAVAGNSMSKGDRGAGTAIGALVGGAAGSWMGCKVQRDRQEARYDGYVQAREDFVRHPAAYRRAAAAEELRREREAAAYRAWQASRYDVRYDYGRYDQDRYGYGGESGGGGYYGR